MSWAPGVRILVASADLETGTVYRPNHPRWLGEWEIEVPASPNNRHDD